MPSRRRFVALTLAVAALALTVVAGSPPVDAATAHTLSFSGRTWTVKTSSTLVGPGPNLFSDSTQNVWVDGTGALHLRLTNRDGAWQCSEVVLNQSLGYGTYRFTLDSSVGALDPSVVLGLFTWSDRATDNHREIDIEFAKWANAADPTNAQYVVQPARAGQVKRFAEPVAAPTTHEFTWTRGAVAFASRDATGQTIAQWSYQARDVPRAGDETARMNLWLDRGHVPTNGAEVEVVVRSFTFTPAG